MPLRNQEPAGALFALWSRLFLLRCERAQGHVLVPTVGENLPSAADTAQHGDPLAWSIHALPVGHLHVVREGADVEGGVANDFQMSCLDSQIAWIVLLKHINEVLPHRGGALRH